MARQPARSASGIEPKGLPAPAGNLVGSSASRKGGRSSHARCGCLSNCPSRSPTGVRPASASVRAHPYLALLACWALLVSCIGDTVYLHPSNIGGADGSASVDSGLRLNTDAGPSEGEDLSPRTFCAAGREAVAKHFENCYGAPASYYLRYFSSVEGLGFRLLRCADNIMETQLGRIDEVSARACINQLSSSTCDEVLRDWDEIMKRCDAAFLGGVPVGGSCADAECLPGAMCDRGWNPAASDLVEWAPGSCTELCVAMNGDLLDGELCDAGERRCARGLYCASPFDSSVGTCTAISREGERCSGRNLCAAGLFCTREEICELRLEPGRACRADSLSPCKGRYTCLRTTQNATQGTCEMMIRRGERCQAGIAPCGPGLNCVDNVCRLRSFVGGLCNPRNSDDCIESWCSSDGERGLCTPYRESGQSCSASRECESAECIGGVCSDRPRWPSCR